MIKSKAGFTLIEILVVVIIIGILAATALMYYGRFIERMRITHALQLFGTAVASQERNMLKKYHYAESWDQLDVTPTQKQTGEIDTSYSSPNQVHYYTNRSGPDGNSGIGDFRPGYDVYFLKPHTDKNTGERWVIVADRIGGGVYADHYYLVRALDDTKTYCIPDGEHADSVTLCMDFMGVSTKEELDALGNPLTSAAGDLGAHDNLASAGKSGTGGTANGEEPAEGDNAQAANFDVEGEGANSNPAAFDVEGGDNQEGENADEPTVPDNTSTPQTPSANDNTEGVGNSDADNDGDETPAIENAPNNPSTPAVTPEEDPEATVQSGTNNPDAGNNSGNNNENAGPGNNSGNANSGNANAGSGNNSGSSESNWWRDAACTVIGWFGIKC